MRSVSKKRRKLNSAVSPWREAFRERVGRCEKCLKKSMPSVLDVHECVIGACRSLALDKEYAVLALHRSCHTEMERLTIPHQLAYLLRARPESFDMPAYHLLTKRSWPDISEVFRYLDQLKEQVQ